MTLCGEVHERAINRSFDATSTKRGFDYANEGRVRNLDVSEGGHALRALVDGSRRDPYRVRVHIDHARGRELTYIAGECTCPIEFNCKHVVAVLGAALLARGSAGEERSSGRDPRVDVWLQEIDESLVEPLAPADTMLYVLDHKPWRRRLELTLHTARRKADGTWGTLHRYSADAAIAGQARMLTADDVHAARLLYATSVLGARFVADMLDEALRIALRTGHVFWKSTAAPLRRGEPRAAVLAWRPDTDGGQRLEALVDGVPIDVACTNRAWGIDAARGEICELQFAQEDRLVARLLEGPPLRDADVPSVIARLTALGAPLPASTVPVEVLDDPPVPHLHLEQADVPMYTWGGPPAPTTVGRLAFLYGDARVTAESPEREWRTATAAGLVVRRRNLAAEAEAVAALTQRGLKAPYVSYGPARPLEAVRPSPRFWANFLTRDVPELHDAGWNVTIADTFPHRIIVSDEPWEAGVFGADDVTLDIHVMVDGMRVELVPLLADAIAGETIAISNDRALVGPLPDGTMVSVPADRLRRLVGVLLDVFDRPELGRADVTIPLARAVGLDALGDELRIDGSAAARVQAAARQLRADLQRPATIPKTLRATLRPYQHEGLTWLQALRAAGFGGILADSMGLGKTVQTLAHLLAERKAGRLDAPALVVAPTSLLPNWEAEAERFAPSLRTLVLHGAQRSQRHDDIADAQLVVTSYALLARDIETLAARDWSVAVLDEAQNIKNPTSKTAKAARRLRAQQRLCLTGTPVENHLEELWSLFAFVDPAVLGERERFRRIFRTPIEKRDDAGRRSALAARIAPFVLRRTKERVALDLPPKSEIVTRVELGETQRDLYETIRAAMHARVQDAIASRGLARSRIVVLDALLKLRQVCCHPKLLPSERAKGVQESAKLDTLRDMVEGMVDDGRRILLFSQFTSMLRLIEEQLRALEIDYVQLTGSTVDRAEPVRRFQSGEVPVFLISLKAGGTGLNLTAADTVIHYDPWWNPAVETQATDRAHRIGQHKPIFVYKLVCEHTVEERILDLQARKGALAAALLDETETATPLDEDEIAQLFA
jgi:superfamily II DNA or RNA helicase